MKTLKQFSGLTEGVRPEGNLNPLIFLYDAKYRLRKKSPDDIRGITGHMLLDTAEGIYKFMLDTTQLKKLKAGGQVVVNDGYDKRKQWVLELSQHSKFFKGE